ncbi:MAG: hypothetical protein WBA01_08775, partial [Phormidesmis sp.]
MLLENKPTDCSARLFGAAISERLSQYDYLSTTIQSDHSKLTPTRLSPSSGVLCHSKSVEIR